MNGMELKKVTMKIDQLGLKKKYVAERCDISPSRLSQFLSGNYEVPEKVKLKLNILLSL